MFVQTRCLEPLLQLLIDGLSGYGVVVAAVVGLLSLFHQGIELVAQVGQRAGVFLVECVEPVVGIVYVLARTYIIVIVERLHVDVVGQRAGVELLVGYPAVLALVVVTHRDALLSVGACCVYVECTGIDLCGVVGREVHFEGEVGVVPFLVGESVVRGVCLVIDVVEDDGGLLQVYGVVVEEGHRERLRHDGVGVVDHLLAFGLHDGIMAHDACPDAMVAQCCRLLQRHPCVPLAVAVGIGIADELVAVVDVHIVAGLRLPVPCSHIDAGGSLGAAVRCVVAGCRLAADLEARLVHHLRYVDDGRYGCQRRGLQRVAVLLAVERIAQCSL